MVYQVDMENVCLGMGCASVGIDKQIILRKSRGLCLVMFWFRVTPLRKGIRERPRVEPRNLRSRIIM